MQFLTGLSKSVLNKYAGERIVLGGDLNCVMNKIDKCGGRSFEQKKMVIQEMKTLILLTPGAANIQITKHSHGTIHPRKSIVD